MSSLCMDVHADAFDIFCYILYIFTLLKATAERIIFDSVDGALDVLGITHMIVFSECLWLSILGLRSGFPAFILRVKNGLAWIPQLPDCLMHNFNRSYSFKTHTSCSCACIRLPLSGVRFFEKCIHSHIRILSLRRHQISIFW